MSRKQAVQGIDKLTAARLKKEHRVRVLAQLRAESYSSPTMTQEQER